MVGLWWNLRRLRRRVRGEQTKRLIVDTAVRLFREQGYDKTTMRAIAQAAGVSVGNAYYYFPSKDHLVQEFYAQVQDAHARRPARPAAGHATGPSSTGCASRCCTGVRGDGARTTASPASSSRPPPSRAPR